MATDGDVARGGLREEATYADMASAGVANAVRASRRKVRPRFTRTASERGAAVPPKSRHIVHVSMGPCTARLAPAPRAEGRGRAGVTFSAAAAAATAAHEPCQPH